MIGDEAGYLFLMSATAKGVDSGIRLFTELLREEVGGDDYREDDEGESDSGTEGTVFNS